ncbi:Crp/Fnr family transcriptional regulator [Bradyrhizobium sp. BWA-3-5]|uniref:Crp/Fnr family transcriptional regulator n=1 Tax=Bradyrhizobium sp. BWA-3-5 TaxID=3080013 RepID=UPI00293E5711|nr:cyclic nucleotide-binding domain-containing protein [Bradyrhizobium sp. BWA-3-5]WOH67971.1 cyclic nucleotide-binding domain-containing protein [Bradyrhizobium sp. BWA-3-5]
MLGADDLAALSKSFATVPLHTGQVIAQPNDEIRRVYFPHSGIISFSVELADGHAVQTGMVGRDGVVGAPQALDDKVSLNKIIVQVSGSASVIDRDPLREANQARIGIRKILAAHAQFFWLTFSRRQPATHCIQLPHVHVVGCFA